MSATIYNLRNSDWVTTIGDVKKPLLDQVFQPTGNLNFVSELKTPKGDGIESVFVRKTGEIEKCKPKKQKKKKQVKNKRVAPDPPLPMLRRVNDNFERLYFKPYTTKCFQFNNLYKSDVPPKYLNGTVASDMKRVPREYWPSMYYTPAPFVASCVTRNTHNVFLLKQETFAKIKAAILPFKSQELNDQSINSLRSIKRSIEKYWKL